MIYPLCTYVCVCVYVSILKQKPDPPEFIPPTLWPPKSPDLKLVNYKVWSVVQQKAYKGRIKDVDELRSPACIS